MSRKNKKLAGIIVGVFAGATAILGAGTIAAYIKDKSDYDVNKPEAFRVLNEFVQKDKELREKYDKYEQELNNGLAKLDPATRNQYQKEIDSSLKAIDDQLQNNQKYVEVVKELNKIQGKYRLGHHLGNKYFYQDKKWRDVADKLAEVDAYRAQTVALLKSNNLMDYLKLNLQLRVAFNSTIDTVLNQPEQNIFNEKILQLYNDKYVNYTEKYQTVSTKLESFNQEGISENKKLTIILEATKKLDEADAWLRNSIDGIYKKYQTSFANNYDTYKDFVERVNLNDNYEAIKKLVVKLDAESVGKQLSFNINQLNKMTKWINDLSSFWNNVSLISQKQAELRSELLTQISNINEQNENIKTDIENANLADVQYSNYGYNFNQTNTLFNNFKNTLNQNNTKNTEFNQTHDWSELLKNAREIMNNSKNDITNLFTQFKTDLISNIDKYSAKVAQFDIDSPKNFGVEDYGVKVKTFSDMVETRANMSPLKSAKDSLQNYGLSESSVVSDFNRLTRVTSELLTSTIGDAINFPIFKDYYNNLSSFVNTIKYGGTNNKYQVNIPQNSEASRTQMNNVIKNAIFSLFDYNSIQQIQNINRQVPKAAERQGYVEAYSKYYNINYDAYLNLSNEVKELANGFTDPESKQLSNAFGTWLLTYLPDLNFKVLKQVVLGDVDLNHNAEIVDLRDKIQNAVTSLEAIKNFVSKVHDLYENKFTLNQFIKYVPNYKNGSNWSYSMATLSNFNNLKKSDLDTEINGLNNVINRLSSSSTNSWSDGNLTSLVNLINANRKIAVASIKNLQQIDYLTQNNVTQELTNMTSALNNLVIMTRIAIQLSPNNENRPNALNIPSGGVFKLLPVPVYYEVGNAPSYTKLVGRPTISYYPGFAALATNHGSLVANYDNSSTSALKITYTINSNNSQVTQQRFSYTYNYTSVENDFYKYFSTDSIDNNLKGANSHTPFNYNWNNSIGKTL